jgi:UDPglucose 6-dehydrogenase
MRTDDSAPGHADPPRGHGPAERVTVFGAGYVGLVSAACLAALGHRVLCMDTDGARVALLERGELPFHEPGLAELILRHGIGGQLRFTTDADEAVAHGDLQFIAVGTPAGEDGSADLGHVLAVARSIGERMTRDVLVIDKSTVPVGTAERVREVTGAALARRGQWKLRVAVASNPEFLREGSAVADFMRPDRVVAGADDPAVLARLRRLYAPLLSDPQRQWMPMSVRSAELAKYAANVMLAARLSMMNDLAQLAAAVGADIEQVRQGVGGDPRIGTAFLAPGCGYGGSCLPKDLRALRRCAADAGLELPMLDAVEAVNERQKTLLVRQLGEVLGGHLAGRRIALWGLAFKPGTDDLREAPSEAVIHALLARGAEVVAHDPLALPAARQRHAALDGLRFAPDPLGAVAGADALLVVTEWPAYREVDWAKVRRCMAGDWVLDGRNVCRPNDVLAHGLNYRGIGRAAREGVAAHSLAAK